MKAEKNHQDSEQQGNIPQHPTKRLLKHELQTSERSLKDKIP